MQFLAMSCLPKTHARSYCEGVNGRFDYSIQIHISYNTKLIYLCITMFSLVSATGIRLTLTDLKAFVRSYWLLDVLYRFIHSYHDKK